MVEKPHLLVGLFEHPCHRICMLTFSKLACCLLQLFVVPTMHSLCKQCIRIVYFGRTSGLSLIHRKPSKFIETWQCTLRFGAKVVGYFSSISGAECNYILCCPVGGRRITQLQQQHHHRHHTAQPDLLEFSVQHSFEIPLHLGR